MVSELAIKETKIDWLELINLALNRKDWGKMHTLFIHGTVSITVKLISMKFDTSSAEFRIDCNYPDDTYNYDDCKYLEYKLNNFTSETFNKYMLKRIITLIEEVVDSRTRRAAESKYLHIHYSTYDIDSDLIGLFDMVDDFYETNNIKNDSARDAALYSLNADLIDLANSEYDLKVRAYRDTHDEFPEYMKDLLDNIKNLIEVENEG